MKYIRILFAVVLTYSGTAAIAQTDTTKNSKPDTIRIGGMIIIKKEGPHEKRSTTVTIGSKHKQRNSNVSTANWILDLGFANWQDKTDYISATTGQFLVNRPGSPAISDDNFKLRQGKSSNVNLWIFMQRLNLVKHYVSLKYGLGIEMYNFRFKAASPLTFSESGKNPYNASQNINHAFIYRDSITFSKNKLAADYATVPFMINFRTNPNNSDKGLSVSAGISIGYLYSTRNKQVSSIRGKDKNHGNYDLEKWKFSYIGELGLGSARLYGSYTPKSIFEKGLNLMPYAVGIRFSNW